MNEVGVVELENLASPSGGGSSLGAESADMDSIVREPDDLAAVGILGWVFDGGAAAFEEEYMFSLSNQFDGKHDASCAGSHDADVGGLRCGFGQALHQVMNQSRDLLGYGLFGTMRVARANREFEKRRLDYERGGDIKRII